MRRWLLPLLAVLALLGIWELYVKASGVSSLVLPSPFDVVRALVDDRGTLWHNLEPTAVEIVLGVLLGAALALLAAVALHFSGVARRAFYPPLVASQAIPIPILGPLVVLWLGFGLLPKLVVVALVCFFPIVVTTLSALAAVDPDLLKLMRTFDAGRLETFRRVELPSALPGLFAGAKLAAVLAVLAAVLAEQAGASSGLGYLLIVTESNLEMSEAFASVWLLAALAMLLFAALSVAERRALPWVHRQRETDSR
ncbi:MAG: ABC transporter permease subunit [Acidobacteriota bacterium]|nr:ABC transporter permease subunit [Acidobacteriota bacterium]